MPAMSKLPATPEILYQGQWLRLVRRGHWESCERTHGKDGLAVLVIALTPNDEVLLVEQYRVPLGARTIEMPAGLVGDEGDDDSLEAAARRELIEETGWDPDRVDILLIGPTSSGMSNERIAFARARDLRKVGAGGGVKDENITVHSIPRREAPAWLMGKYAEGFELDPKLWAGLWMLDYNPDGSPIQAGTEVKNPPALRVDSLLKMIKNRHFSTELNHPRQSRGLIG